MIRIVKAIRAWIPFAVVVTALCALISVSIQQVLRQDANDPQIQMAEDAAAALNGGATTDSLISKNKVELASSLAPFLVVYDSTGKPVAGSGTLDGKLPGYPIGALEASRGGENRVTWQPRGGVRIASVAVPYNGGYVVAGRSLLEVEQRKAQIQGMAAAAWLLSLGALFVVLVIFVP